MNYQRYLLMYFQNPNHFYVEKIFLFHYDFAKKKLRNLFEKNKKSIFNKNFCRGSIPKVYNNSKSN